MVTRPRIIKTFKTLQVTAMKAVGPKDVWVFTAHRPVERPFPQAHHWDGRKWRRVALPPGTSGLVHDVDGTAPDDLWAVVAGDSDSSTTQGVLRWNGRSWKLVKRLPGGPVDSPNTITVPSRGRVWVLKIVEGGTDLWRFDGRRWSSRRAKGLVLYTPVVRSATDIWA
ncbi:hypothetical protein, partial [Actinocorallia lasiicapitis]